VNWWKASTSSAIAQMARMVGGLLLLKVIAVSLGPEGFGRLGHFMSLIAILSVLAGGGILNGIVKYIAEYRQLPQKLTAFVSSAFTYSFIFSIILFSLLLVFAEELSLLVFKGTNEAHLIRFLGLVQIFYSGVTFCNGIVNGLRETERFARITVVGVLIGLPISCYFAYVGGLPGAVIGLALLNVGMLLPGLIEIYRLGYFKRITLLVNGYYFRRISQFSLMQMFSLATLPLAEIYLRTLIIADAGFSQAGIWQSVMRLSAVYTSFFATFLAAYYMPTLSGMAGRREVVKYVGRYMLSIAGLFLLVAGLIFLFRDFVFSLVFSREFVIPAGNVGYQLIGDFFKILSYTIGFLLVAKASTKLYIFSELVQTACYLGVAVAMIRVGGISQIFPAYAVANLLYFVFCASGFIIYAKGIRSA
jgi:O-antigen/teichoic acid export membrane protein